MQWFTNLAWFAKLIVVYVALGILFATFGFLAEDASLVVRLFGALILLAGWIVIPGIVIGIPFFGFLKLRFALFYSRDVVRCKSCNGLATRREWSNHRYRCPGCGSDVFPELTGAREPGLVLPGWQAPDR